MHARVLTATRGGLAAASDVELPVPPGGWRWVDVAADGAEADLLELAGPLRLDPLAVRDAVDERDLPKVDDFGHHLLVVLHGLSSDVIGTYEVDCFLTADHLVTVHSDESPSIDALWEQVQQRPELASGGPDELLGRLADVVSRRLLLVVEAFDERVEELTRMALAADARLVADLTAVRSDVATVRRVVHPQREALDQLRHTPSELVSDAGRRRFSDVFDVAARTAHGLDAARSALSETLEAYRGAEARAATEVTKLLTVYAAVILPLSLIAGIFGMNFPNLPGLGESWGWAVVVVVMLAIAALSLGMFVAAGWIGRLRAKEAGVVLGRGLVEVSKAPIQLVGALFEVGAVPLRYTVGRRHEGRPADE
jgi:magnesium transporter